VLQAAIAWEQAGVSVMPVKANGSKAPALRKWEHLQERRLTPKELRRMFENGEGVGMIGGAVSGNLEGFDFDTREIYGLYIQRGCDWGYSDLMGHMQTGYVEQSPKGFHWIYRVSGLPKPPKSQKLALRTLTPEEAAAAATEAAAKNIKPVDRKTLIETKAEGGYLIIAPSSAAVGTTGEPYTCLNGSPKTILTICSGEQSVLHMLARSFDEFPELAKEEKQHGPTDTSGTRPGDIFARHTDWAEILQPHGWALVYEKDGAQYWRRPGKDIGVSASTNHADSDYLYIFSTSTDFEANRGYGKFAAYTLLNHGGDHQAAAAALAQAQGGNTLHGIVTNMAAPNGVASHTLSLNGSSVVHVLPDGVTDDDVENWADYADEQPLDSEEAPTFPCPDALWHGPFARMADALGERSWEVWGSLYSAFGAFAGHHLHLKYEISYLFGPSFLLIVGQTGRGKSLVRHLTEASLPPWFRDGANPGFRIVGSPASGPALGPLVASYERDSKKGGKIKQETIKATPCMSLITEFSQTLKSAHITGSTICETFNDLFDGLGFTSHHSDNPKAGAGTLSVPNAEYSLVATSTQDAIVPHLLGHVAEVGTANRLLILPLTERPFTFRKTERLVDYEAVKELGRELYAEMPYPLGGTLGANFWDVLTPDAYARLVEMEAFFQDIAASPNLVTQRLHLHCAKIAALSAFMDRREVIDVQDVEMAAAVVTASHDFIDTFGAVDPLSDPNTPPIARYQLKQVKTITERLGRIDRPMDTKGIFQGVRKSMPRMRDVRTILGELVDNGQVMAIKREKGGALFWLTERALPGH
jgi:hypothetical protein